jgi:hypothetical protein
MGALVSVVLPALAMGMADAPGPVDVVVTAAPPIDGQRLADALRAYLDGFGIRIENAAPGEWGDLRRQLAEARRIGQAVRAVAVVRAQKGDGGDDPASDVGDGDGGGGDARGTIEIEIVDLATEKVLIAQVPRPRRDEDLYRALALKIQATLRLTLSEAPERLGPRVAMTRLARSGSDGIEREPPVDSPVALSLETGYQLFSFPLAGVQLQGLAVALALAVRPWLELTLGGSVLDSVRAEGAGVVAVGTVVPLVAAARVRAARGRFEGLAGPAVGLAYVEIVPSSPTVSVTVQRHLVPALGVEVEGRLRLRPAAWLYGRVAGMGVLLGERYRAEGQVLVDTSRFQAALSAGIGIGLR